jgi:hypothetical protein
MPAGGDGRCRYNGGGAATAADGVYRYSRYTAGASRELTPTVAVVDFEVTCAFANYLSTDTLVAG